MPEDPKNKKETQNPSLETLGLDQKKPNISLDAALQELDKEPEPIPAEIEEKSDSKFVEQTSLTEKPNKRRLIIAVLIALFLLIGIGSGTAFALWYNNPNKVVSDAFVDALTAKTYISDGNFSYTNSQDKGKVIFTFKSKGDTPNVKGQFDAGLKVDYDKYKFNIDGAGLLSESGNLYFKFDGVKESLDKYIEEPEIKTYTDQNPQLKDEIVTFVHKIDGQWVKLDKRAINDFLKDFNHSKGKTCLTKAYDQLSSNPQQKQQIYDAYADNPFITVKDKGSEDINGTDSIKYKVSADVQRFYKATDALEESEFAKNTQKCVDQFISKDTINQSSETKAGEKKYRDEQADSQQKQIDKADVNVWISRWGHQLTKTSYKYTDAKNHTTAKGEINYSFNKTITAKDPQKSIPLKEFQDDIEKLQSSITQLDGGSSESASSLSPKSEVSQVASAVVSFQSNNRGKSPTSLTLENFASYLDATTQGSSLLLPSGYTVVINEVAPTSNKTMTSSKKIDIWLGASCDENSQNVVASSRVRNAAIITKLENGENYCQDI